MAFDERTVAEIVRHRLQIPNSAKNAAIIFQIPTALEALARKVAANPKKRPLLTTIREETEIALVLGGVDLKSYNNTAAKKLLVEYLKNGDIFYESSILRSILPCSSIAAYDLIYHADHGLTPGQPIQFPAGSSLPGVAFANDTTYYVIIPTQQLLDTTGFVGAVPKDYIRVASSLANANNGIQMDMSFSNLDIVIRTNDGTLDTDPLEPVTMEQSRRIANHPHYGDYRFYYLDGQTLRVVDVDSQNFAVGSLHFAVPYQPATLADIADIKELHDDLIEKLVEICAGLGNDLAQDGEH